MDRTRCSERRKQSSILCGISILLLVHCGPSYERQDVVMELEPFKVHYGEFEKRANFWFCGRRVPGRQCAAMPTLPPAEEEYPKFRWVEEDAPWKTCTSNSNSERTIAYIPADKWGSGCVPHEIGHGVLRRLNHPCWKVFEHTDVAPESCK